MAKNAAKQVRTVLTLVELVVSLDHCANGHPQSNATCALCVAKALLVP